MIDGEKIGVGIVTCGRPELFKKCFSSITQPVDEIIVIVDRIFGNTLDNLNVDIDWIQANCKRLPDSTPYPEIIINWNESNMGVGKSKNRALKYLLDSGCDHIFLIEDDIFVRDPKVFEKYIEASRITGIQHFNFSQHGRMNKKWEQRAFPDVIPNPRIVIDYGSIKLPLYPHCVGAFSYYSKKCLETVGLLDEQYYNACEHVDHTLQVIKAGMHPPFWYFADIENSSDYLGDEEWSIEKSTISSNPNHQQMMKDADHIFVKKHGHYPGQTPMVDLDEVGKQLKQIRAQYGRPNDSNL